MMSPSFDQQSFSYLGSSLACSSFGEIFSLKVENGLTITRSTLTGNGSDGINSTKQFPIKSSDSSGDFHHIICNEKGDIVILWSKFNLARMEIDGEQYKPSSLMTIEMNNPIVKVDFHPLNDYSLVVLLKEGSLCVVDLRTCKKQNYSLPPNISFTSFCFGPDIEWLRFTVFVTSAFGEIFALCPVIPLGTILPASVVFELYEWVDKYQGGSYGDSETLQSYFSHTRNYLDNFFHSYDGPNNSGSNCFIFEDKSNTQNGTFQLELLGPIQTIPTNNENEVSICDIISCSFRKGCVQGHPAPTLTTVDSLGTVNFWLLDPQDDDLPLSFPAWKEVVPSSWFAFPDLLLGENIVVDKESSQSPHDYSLQPGIGTLTLVESGWVNSVLGSFDKIEYGNDTKQEKAPQSRSWTIIEPSEAGQILGAVVSQHPLVGNILLFDRNQEINVLNLSIHRRFRDLYSSYVNPFPLKPAKNLPSDFFATHYGKPGGFSYFQNRQQEFFLNVASGFANLPPFTQQAKSTTVQNDEAVLFQTAELLKEKVVAPLLAFSELLPHHQNAVLESLKSQRMVLFGEEKQNSQPSLSILKLLERLREQDELLKNRLKALIERNQAFKEKLLPFLSLVLNSRKQMTKAELFYKEKCEKWKADIDAMQGSLSAVKVNIQLLDAKRSSTSSKKNSLDKSVVQLQGSPVVVTNLDSGIIRGWKRLHTIESPNREELSGEVSLAKLNVTAKEEKLVLSSEDAEVCQLAIQGNDESLLQAKMKLANLLKRIEKLKHGLGSQ